MFPSFKLPQLLRKSSPGSEICQDVPRFKCSELPVKQRIGQGSFGDVYTSEYKDSEDTKSQTVVMKKMLQVLDKEEKKLFYKKVKLLNDLDHPNIVRLKGISFQPLAMMQLVPVLNTLAVGLLMYALIQLILYCLQMH